MKKIRCEINLTQRCQLSCGGCNRGLGDIAKSHWHENHDDMTVEQIVAFIDYARQAKQQERFYIGRAKILGGEPTTHPRFQEIYWLLAAAIDEGVIESVKISTNCVDPVPEWCTHPRMGWAFSPVRRKKHTPITWSPVDLGVKTKLGCSMLTRCGASLSKDGWLPCSAAIFIVKVFDLEHLYKKEIPTEPWGLEELCRNCIHSMPQNWVDSYFKTHKGLEKVEPTETWRKALAAFEERKGVKERRFSVSLPMVSA